MRFQIIMIMEDKTITGRIYRSSYDALRAMELLNSLAFENGFDSLYFVETLHDSETESAGFAFGA